MSKIKATVFIPTYNGEKYIKEILNAVYSQKTDFDYEVLIIDSGSKDKTLDIIKAFKNRHDSLRLHIIDNDEYGHGKTRNLAAHMAKGDIVAYLSHDATPSHNRWLYEMVKPFEINDKIIGVMGKQIPRNWCIPMLKSEINGVFNGFGPDFGTTIFYKDDFVKSQSVYDAVSFYSDANSAARRDYLTGELPYQDVNYAEDQLFGRDIINAGYYKMYAPRASVVHSNDLRLNEYRSRMFDETAGLRKIGVPVSVPSRKSILRMLVRGVIRDTRNILRDSHYSTKRKIYWLMVNPLFHIEKWRGVRLGSRIDLNNIRLSDKYSLESNRKIIKS
jgi:rhamnosyltransferase